MSWHGYGMKNPNLVYISTRYVKSELFLQKQNFPIFISSFENTTENLVENLFNC